MTDDEGGWSDQEPVGEDMTPGDAPSLDATYEAYAEPASTSSEGVAGAGVIDAQFQVPIASHAYSDAEITALLQAGLPDSVASLATGTGQETGDENV